MVASGSGCFRDCRRVDHAEQVGFLHDEEVLAIYLDLGAGPLPKKHAVPRLHIERNDFAALVPSAGTGGDDLSFLRLLLRGVGNDDAAGRLLLGVIQ